ncbi:shikimate O-hydroxycinnamoyltransferase-like [Papaver somniferum]|uniref:shikimate O-hydroxycinnamoyltransferase-like n=1 Tax=Papaver somniferum TaxID=3469 RepID=UPI000E6F4D30|nr:shikimate O-hydroxycinnamoyltransferase-like [Papaver somniferum]
METLIHQKCLPTHFLQNSSSFVLKSKTLSKLYSFQTKPSEFGSIFAPPHVVKCVKANTNSGPWKKMLESLPRIATHDDLKVELQNASMVVPVEVTERRSMFLSNIDQSVNIYCGAIGFFSAIPNFPPDLIAKKLEFGLKRLLAEHYDFLAGRLKWDSKQGRLEIDCNLAGVGFITASSKLSLEEVGDLQSPNTAFEQLAPQNWNELWPKDQPLFIMQVTAFKCGGVSVAAVYNHTTLDGYGCMIFLEHLASMTADSPDLPYPPVNNRHLLDARTPPHVTEKHVEFIDLGRIAYASTPSVFISKADNLERKNLLLTAEDIEKLKKQATVSACISDTKGNKFASSVITSFNVVAAHTWRCMALLRSNKEESETPSTFLFPVNIRARLRPRFPPSYTGNALVNGYGMATYKEIAKKPFAYLVEKIAAGAKRVKDKYIRSVIDWRELHNGYVFGDVMITSWWKLPFIDLKCPWGKPLSIVPIAHQWSNLVILMPDNREVESKGVNVLVSLPTEDMERFEHLFYKLLS